MLNTLNQKYRAKSTIQMKCVSVVGTFSPVFLKPLGSCRSILPLSLPYSCVEDKRENKNIDRGSLSGSGVRGLDGRVLSFFVLPVV